MQLGTAFPGESRRANLPGCAFHPRCRYRTELCVASEPPLLPTTDGVVACHYPLARAGQTAAQAAL